MIRKITSRLCFLIFLFFTQNLIAAKIPEDYKQTVSFVFINDSSGKLIPYGTGFFVSVPDENNKNNSFGYFVTAKHVLQANGKYLSNILIRLNTRDGKSEFLKIPTSGNNASTILVHTDPDVDIVAIPLFPDAQKYQYKFIPENMIISTDVYKADNIWEGDDVFFIGLFASYFGNQRNYPIVRFGRLAMKSDEKIPWQEEDKDQKLLDLYLIESQSFGGNSGSPVFFYLGSDRNPGSLSLSASFFLAGVMKGSWMEGRDVKVVNTSSRSVSYQNLGIAAVIPGYYLHDILHSDIANRLRSNH